MQHFWLWFVLLMEWGLTKVSASSSSGGGGGGGEDDDSYWKTPPPPLLPQMGPHFDVAGSGNVTALVGKTAYLNCRVKNLSNKTVSWVRHRDIHLLTVGRYTYTSDQRFEVLHSLHSEDWTLQIKYPQRRDTGVYECQISTTPPIGHFVHLTVVEPITAIVGNTDVFINKGSTINLTCVVKFAPEPPPQIHWHHNMKIINFDSPRGGISLVTEKGPTTTSRLLIQKATQADSGLYTCAPSNANEASVRVHILNGEHPAAMQHGGQSTLLTPPSALLFTLPLLAWSIRSIRTSL